MLLAGLLLELHAIGLFLPEPLPWLADGIWVLAAALCFRFSVSLLPEDSALSPSGDRAQRRRGWMQYLYTGLSLATLGLWAGAVLLLRESLEAPLWLGMAGLTVCLTLLVLGYIRQLALRGAERTEALMDKQYQNDLLSFMQVIRSQRHDFNFHMRTISSLIQQKQYQACDDYVQQMVHSASAMNDILPLSHPATSAMIHAFWELSRQKGITFHTDISSDLAQMPCTIYETNTIIGNLLQNAIDELEQAGSQGPLELLILFRGGHYIIRVANPCRRGPAELRDMFQPGYSTKQSHEGLGLAAVRRIADRHGGAVFPEFGQGQIRMIVQIPFCA